MRCITIINPGPDNRLEITEQNIPLCNPDEILVKVHAAALNRADLLQRQGKYPHPPGESDILGLELSGEVVTLGKNVQKFKLGERVYGLVAGGALAEYCLVNQYLAALIPDHWDYTYAAALPEALTTAHATIFLLGELKTDDHLLIHAAGSGISSLAIQMASHIGATVFSTVSNQKKMDMAHALGASTVINYKTQDFATIIKSNSLDLIVDFIGKTYFTKHLECLKPLGKLVQIATMQGRLVELDLALLMRKRLQINGFVLRSQSLIEKSALWESAQQQWKNLLLNNSIKPIIDSLFAFEEIEKAYTHMQESGNFGKIVISLG